MRQRTCHNRLAVPRQRGRAVALNGVQAEHTRRQVLAAHHLHTELAHKGSVVNGDGRLHGRI